MCKEKGFLLTLAAGGQKLLDTGIVPDAGGEGSESTDMDLRRITSPVSTLHCSKPGYGRNTPGDNSLRVPMHSEILSPIALL